MGNTPGPRMVLIVAYVIDHPGCSKSDAARGGYTGPLYSDSLERAIRRGLVHQESYSRSRYRLFATDAGRAFAAGHPAPVKEKV